MVICINFILIFYCSNPRAHKSHTHDENENAINEKDLIEETTIEPDMPAMTQMQPQQKINEKITFDAPDRQNETFVRRETT